MLDRSRIFMHNMVHTKDSRSIVADDNDDRYDESGRTSIWSVRAQDRFQFSVIFFTLFLIGLAIVVYYEVWLADSKSLIATVIALIRDIGAVGLASLIITLVRFEGGDAIMGIAYELYKKYRYEAGYKAGIEEGRRLEREAQRRRQANGGRDAGNDDKNSKQ